MKKQKNIKIAILISSYFLIFPFWNVEIHDNLKKTKVTEDAGQHFFMASKSDISWDNFKGRWWLRRCKVSDFYGVSNYGRSLYKINTSNINIPKTLYIFIISFLFSFAAFNYYPILIHFLISKKILSLLRNKNRENFIKNAKYKSACLKCGFKSIVNSDGLSDLMKNPCPSCNESSCGKSNISVDSDDYSENSILKSYFILSGRIGRKRYLIETIFGLFLFLLFSILLASLEFSYPTLVAISPLCFYILLSFPLVRRLHDISMSGYFSLFVINIGILPFLSKFMITNKLYSNMNIIELFIWLFLIVTPLTIIILAFSRKGDRKCNVYGASVASLK